MIRECYQQFAIVQADTAQQLTAQLNTELRRLRKKRPHVEFEGLIARISYEEDVDIIEDLADEYQAVGVKLTCQDCPCFEPMRKSDGSIHKRAKWGDCPHVDCGRTLRDMRACDKLFQMINSGEVKLCFAD